MIQCTHARTLPLSHAHSANKRLHTRAPRLGAGPDQVSGPLPTCRRWGVRSRSPHPQPAPPSGRCACGEHGRRRRPHPSAHRAGPPGRADCRARSRPGPERGRCGSQRRNAAGGFGSGRDSDAGHAGRLCGPPRLGGSPKRLVRRGRAEIETAVSRRRSGARPPGGDSERSGGAEIWGGDSDRGNVRSDCLSDRIFGMTRIRMDNQGGASGLNFGAEYPGSARNSVLRPETPFRISVLKLRSVTPSRNSVP